MSKQSAPLIGEEMVPDVTTVSTREFAVPIGTLFSHEVSHCTRRRRPSANGLA